MFRSVDHYRRLQIGGIGLAAVILLVGLAGILADQKGGSAFSFDNDVTDVIRKDKAPTEPLSELGVQPAPPSETPVPQMRPTLPRSANGNVNGNGSANTLPPTVRPGERVQDLPPSTTAPRAQ